MAPGPVCDAVETTMLVSQLRNFKVWLGPGYKKSVHRILLALYHIGPLRGILAKSFLPGLANLLGAGYIETLAPVHSTILKCASKCHETRRKV